MKKFKRILLKLSGEAMMGNEKFGIDPNFIFYLAEEIKKAHKTGVEIVIVVGGGNIFRGVAGSKQGIDRTTADYMGMLATIFNSMALQDALERKEIPTRLQLAFEIKEIGEPFIRKRAIRHLEKGRIVIAGGGTGLPFITTDTASAIRALELNCDSIFKATNVDGVYSKDPKKDPTAKKYEQLSLEEAFKSDDITIMDNSAIDLCRTNKINIVVFDINKENNLVNAVLGKNVGTIIS
ncbi:MAG: Uridylate kinase [Parcubacteria group bacterium ADurb.Bin247]|jgi:uridylate kinase|nr:MAG: Uridylate kinase [Parcubacteria group bacterium ADurb.Bin247]